MKKILIYLLIAMPILYGCSEENPEIEVDLIIELDEFHQAIMESTFEKFNNIITVDTIKYALNQSDTKESFMAYMSRLQNGYFIEAAKNEPRAEEYFLNLGSPDSKAYEQQEIDVLSLLTTADPVENYIQKLEEEVGGGDDGHKDWIDILSLGSPVQESNNNLRVNKDQIQLALNFAKVMRYASDEQFEEHVDDLKASEVPRVLIGLLLPAVQRPREAPKNSQTAKWLDENVNPAVSGALDRDIIRRISVMAYLGSMDMFLSQEYAKDNQYYAAIEISKAGHETMVKYVWHYIWESQPQQ